MSSTIVAMGSALLEGVGLILSPCILPVLPIMLASSVDGGKRRPLGIITGFILAFTAFALLSRQILNLLHVDPEVIRNAALALLVLFGAIMLSPKLSEHMLRATERLANTGQNLASRWDRKEGFLSGIAVGGLIGLIWTPCAGPIMAAAIVQIIQAKTSLQVVLTVSMFALGAGIPMLLIALLGRRFMSQMSFFKTHSTAVRSVLGIVIILAAILIYKGVDIDLLSGGAADKATKEPSGDSQLLKVIPEPYAAPDLTKIAGPWLNHTALTGNDLRGHVVLVDFWTYSCINCVRTLSYLTKWDEEYRDKGLIIIGVHSPEFEFEKNTDNVKTAIEKYGIHYPVVQDNDLQIWTAFNNRYWPEHYLIDQSGRIVYTHYGEGDYDVTEHNIRALLQLTSDAGKTGAKAETGVQPDDETPETYLGYARADRLTSKTTMTADEVVDFQPVYFVPKDHWTLSGKWRVEKEKIVSQDNSSFLRLNFKAKKVFVVMGTMNGKPQKVTVSLNDEDLGYQTGKDVHDNSFIVDGHALFEVVSQHDFDNSLLQINAPGPGLEIYAFTFGN